MADRRAAHHARRRGYHLSAQARANMSAARKGKPHPHKGHPQTAATRAKISAALKGKRRGGKALRRNPAGGVTQRRAVQHARRRGFLRTGTAASAVARSRVMQRRIVAGARRGFFRHELHVSARHHRWMRKGYRVKAMPFLKKRRTRR